jgi:hypothetical protein
VCDWKTEWLTPDEADAAGRDHVDQSTMESATFLLLLITLRHRAR